MPFKKYNKKKTYKRRKTAKRILAVMRPRPRASIKTYSSNVGMPIRKFTTLTYHESLKIAPPITGTQIFYNFHMNSLFDPNATGGGHKPLGFDQLAAFYKQYRVHGVTMTATFSNTVTNTTPVHVGIAFDKNAAVEASLDTKIETSKGTATRLLLTNSRERATLRRSTTMKKFFSVKDIGDDHQLQAPTSANPTLLGYALVWAQTCITPPANSVDILVNVQLDYKCEFFDPIELVGSV